jgi:CHASE3 domain sensor protein
MEVYEWRAAVLDAEAGARGYIASEQAAFLDPYNSGLERARTKASLLRSLVADNPTQLQNVEAADRDGQLVMDDLRELVTLVKAGHREEALARLGYGDSKPRLDKFRADIHTVRSEEDRLLVARRSDVASRGWIALLGAILLALASGGLLTLAWRRERAHHGLTTRQATEAR